MQGASVGTSTDLFYEGDGGKWIKFINTLKMRAALTTGDYNGVINATNVIESAEDNFTFAYGTNLQQPDTRHEHTPAEHILELLEPWPRLWQEPRPGGQRAQRHER